MKQKTRRKRERNETKENTGGGAKNILKGQLWGGFQGECKKRNPCYVIPGKNKDGVFICDIIRRLVTRNVEIRLCIKKK